MYRLRLFRLDFLLLPLQLGQVHLCISFEQFERSNVLEFTKVLEMKGALLFFSETKIDSM